MQLSKNGIGTLKEDTFLDSFNYALYTSYGEY